METFSFSHGIYKSRNQRTFGIQKSITYRSKGLQKRYWMKIFSGTMTETITIEKPKNPETVPSNMVCPWKVFNNVNILYIVWKVLKRRIEQWFFRKH